LSISTFKTIQDNEGADEMRKRNVLAIVLFITLFLGSICLYFFNSYQIKDNKSKTESLRLELESLKSEKESLIKANFQLIETNSNLSEKVSKLKPIKN
jgi:flagellar basal body-associated protein FliL